MTNPSLSAAPLIVLAAWFAGCSEGDPPFPRNAVYARRWERQFREDFSAARLQELRRTSEALFGTPDKPHLSDGENTAIRSLLDPAQLDMAAGPVYSNEQGRPKGLYRRHCASCHGLGGDGAGPLAAAFLYPYPRDFRAGIFKFKSTPKGCKPTHADLKTIISNGIPGTAMPAYRALPDEEIEALVHYVKYLSIRGEFERRLIDYAAELDPAEPLIDENATPAGRWEENAIVREITTKVIASWAQADSVAFTPPTRSGHTSGPAAMAKGRALFLGEVAGCFKCHGATGGGDGQTSDFDDWTKEIEPASATAVADYRRVGALAPGHIRPRNLRQGVFRGGGRPETLYVRIRNGIDGTPMPAALLRPDSAPPDAQGLTDEDIWCLVDYVLSLSHR